MKRKLVLLCTIICILITAGCGKAEKSANSKREPLLVITVQGESFHPYEHFANSAHWKENGFLYADGVAWHEELPRLDAEGLIPQIVYGEDFRVVLDESAQLREAMICDARYQRLKGSHSFETLSKLDAGTYYVGILVKQLGDYIKEADRNEYVGMVYVFRLIVEQ